MGKKLFDTSEALFVAMAAAIFIVTISSIPKMVNTQIVEAAVETVILLLGLRLTFIFFGNRAGLVAFGLLAIALGLAQMTPDSPFTALGFIDEAPSVQTAKSPSLPPGFKIVPATLVLKAGHK